MNRMIVRFLAGLSLASYLAGCGLIPDGGGGSPRPPADLEYTADVRLQDPETSEPMDIKVASLRNNELSRAAVKELQVYEYDAARMKLEEAVADKAQDYEEHFMLAVTYEKLDRIDDAIKYYKEANRLRTTAEAKQGLDRCMQRKSGA